MPDECGRELLGGVFENALKGWRLEYTVRGGDLVR